MLRSGEREIGQQRPAPDDDHLGTVPRVGRDSDNDRVPPFTLQQTFRLRFRLRHPTPRRREPSHRSGARRPALRSRSGRPARRPRTPVRRVRDRCQPHFDTRHRIIRHRIIRRQLTRRRGVRVFTRPGTAIEQVRPGAVERSQRDPFGCRFDSEPSLDSGPLAVQPPTHPLVDAPCGPPPVFEFLFRRGEPAGLDPILRLRTAIRDDVNQRPVPLFQPSFEPIAHGRVDRIERLRGPHDDVVWERPVAQPIQVPRAKSEAIERPPKRPEPVQTDTPRSPGRGPVIGVEIPATDEQRDRQEPRQRSPNGGHVVHAATSRFASRARSISKLFAHNSANRSALIGCRPK